MSDRQAGGFAAVAGQLLASLQARYGMDLWLVVRRAERTAVVLEVAGSGFGLAPGDRVGWERTLLSRMAEGAPRFAVDVRRVAAYDGVGRTLPGRVAGYLAVPLLGTDGRCLGGLCALAARPAEPGLADALPELEMDGRLLGALLESELAAADADRRSERAGQSGAVDVVTGLVGRRAFDAAVAAEEVRSARNGTAAGVIVLGLDQLREANAAGGLPVGDDLLRTAAYAVSGEIAAGDLLARVGGDELGVLVLGASPAELAAITPRLVAALARVGVAASAGQAARGPGTDLPAAWRAATAARCASRLAVPPPLGRPRGGAAEPDRPRAWRQQLAAVTPALTALLRQAREYLGMEVAFLSEFVGDDQVLRGLQSARHLPVEVGDLVPLRDSYCLRIIDGRLPALIRDTRADPIAAGLPSTDSLDIGSYVGVPVIHEDGQFYGTLCCFDSQVATGRSEADVAFLRGIAAAAVELLGVERQQAEQRHGVLRRLDRLLGAGGPQVALQPVVELDSGRSVGHEALSRFPSSFGLTVTEWFAQAAAAGVSERLELAAASAALATLPLLDGWLAVNLSPDVLASPRLLPLLAQVPPERLVVEVTEHDAVTDYDALAAVLAPLRASGVRLAVDDAGAGFASLRHVVRLSPDLIKIDISLVHDIDVDPARQALVAGLASFAERTGARVIAEGIETPEERATVVRLGIPLGQGMLLGPPRRPAALGEQAGVVAAWPPVRA